jgi:dTDP-glucose 4,6-dehydratase
VGEKEVNLGLRQQAARVNLLTTTESTLLAQRLRHPIFDGSETCRAHDLAPSQWHGRAAAAARIGQTIVIENFKGIAEPGKVERVVQTLDLGAIAWGGAEQVGISTTIKSSSDSIQANNSFSVFNGSVPLTSCLSQGRKQNCDYPYSLLQVVGESELPAEEVDMVPGGEESNQAINGIAQNDAIKIKSLPATGDMDFGLPGRFSRNQTSTSSVNPKSPEPAIANHLFHRRDLCRAISSLRIPPVLHSSSMPSATTLLGNRNNILVTGCAGLISEAVVRHWLLESKTLEFNLYKYCYASGHTIMENVVQELGQDGESSHRLLQGGLADANTTAAAVQQANPDMVLRLAAGSHVDRSIEGQGAFIESNVTGTFILLQVLRAHWEQLPQQRCTEFCFHHTRTDQIFGSLGATGRFSETTSCDRRSPYSASKPGGDHLLQAWHHAYGLPVVLSNCSKNFGPWQFPEKMIPLVILKAAACEPIPYYSDGQNVRDRLYVEYNVDALLLAGCQVQLGESYGMVIGQGSKGSTNERTNNQEVDRICSAQLVPAGATLSRLITPATGCHGHGQRYFVNPSKNSAEMGWEPHTSFGKVLAVKVCMFLTGQSIHEILSERSIYSGQPFGLSKPSPAFALSKPTEYAPITNHGHIGDANISGATMAIITHHSMDIQVRTVDLNAKEIASWNHQDLAQLPVYKQVLHRVEEAAFALIDTLEPACAPQPSLILPDTDETSRVPWQARRISTKISIRPRPAKALRVGWDLKSHDG